MGNPIMNVLNLRLYYGTRKGIVRASWGSQAAGNPR